MFLRDGIGMVTFFDRKTFPRWPFPMHVSALRSLAIENVQGNKQTSNAEMKSSRKMINFLTILPFKGVNN